MAAEGSNQGDEIFVIEAILDKRVTKSGQILYYVKWQGYSSEDNTWERIQDLNCWKIIEMFEKALREKSPSRKRKKRSTGITPAPREQVVPSTSTSKIIKPTLDVKVKDEPVVPSTSTSKIIRPTLGVKIPRSASSSTESMATVCYEEYIRGDESVGKPRRSARVTNMPTNEIKTEVELPDTPIKRVVPGGRGRPRTPGQNKRAGLPVRCRTQIKRRHTLDFKSHIASQRKDHAGADLALQDMARKNISNALTEGKEPSYIIGIMVNENENKKPSHLVMFPNDYVESIPVPYMRLGYPQLLIDFYERKLDIRDP